MVSGCSNKIDSLRIELANRSISANKRIKKHRFGQRLPDNLGKWMEIKVINTKYKWLKRDGISVSKPQPFFDRWTLLILCGIVIRFWSTIRFVACQPLWFKATPDKWNQQILFFYHLRVFGNVTLVRTCSFESSISYGYMLILGSIFRRDNQVNSFHYAYTVRQCVRTCITNHTHSFCSFN